VGFAGPVGFRGRVVIDREAADVTDGITGANETDFHLAHVNHGRDFQAEVAALRQVEEGDGCPRCEGTLASYRGIEGGHIFILGTHYSEKMGATFLDADGKAKPFVMGCYGIGVSRLMATAVEQHHDENGIRWPMSIAPYSVIVTPLGKDPSVHEAATGVYDELRDAGVEVLLDDRDERPGVKFKDADLLGIPLRITVGGRGLERGVVELKSRSEENSKEIARSAIVDATRAAIEAALVID
jgi:prolyl-tRNA synthetase